MEKLAIIGDKDTLTGFKIAGVLENKNIYENVSHKTATEELLRIFKETSLNKEIAIIFVCDFVAVKIKQEIENYNEMLPSIIIIPSSKSKLCKEIK